MTTNLEGEQPDEPSRLIQYNVDGKPIIIPSLVRLQIVTRQLVGAYNAGRLVVNTQLSQGDMFPAIPSHGWLEISIEPPQPPYCIYIEHEMNRVEVGTTILSPEPYHWILLQEHFDLRGNTMTMRLEGTLQIPQAQYRLDASLQNLCRRLYRIGR